MGTRGRKPTPTAIKEVRGNPGKRPLPKVEVHPEPASGRAPNGLSKGVGAFWRRYAPALRDLGVLTQIDEPALRLMAEHFDVAVQAAETLQATGLLVTDHNGEIRKNPAAQVFRDNSASFRSYAAEFGMTPSSRARLTPSDVGQLTLDELFAQVMGGSGAAEMADEDVLAELIVADE